MFPRKLYLSLILVLACGIQKTCNRSNAPVILIGRNLDKIPKIYNGTISITLTKNHISHITVEDVEGYQKLEYLKIDGNEIRGTADMQGIRMLRALKYIDLSDNDIRAFDFRVFRHNENLETIILDHNRKTHFHKNTVTLPAVRKLSIKHSNIDDSFPWDVLSGFENLEILDLSRNKIKSIPNSVFNHLKNLLIDQNNISSINPKDMEGYQALEYLKIGKNEIRSTADMQGIRKLQALKFIDLSDNDIWTFDFRVFRHNDKLENITIDRNPNIQFNKNTVTLPAVTTLSIKYCSLDDSFPWGILEGFTNLKHLDLRYNNIKTIPKHVYELLKDKLELDDGVLEEVREEQKGIEKEIKKEKNMEENNTLEDTKVDKFINTTNAQDKVGEEDTVKDNRLDAELGKNGNLTEKNTKEEKPDSNDNKRKQINSTLKPSYKPDEKNRETEKDSSSLLGSILVTVLVICFLVLLVILSLYFYSKGRRGRTNKPTPSSNSEPLLDP